MVSRLYYMQQTLLRMLGLTYHSPLNPLMVAKVGREDLVYQHLILGVNSHALVIVTDMVKKG